MLLKKMFFFGVIGIINTAVDWSAFWALGQVLPKTGFAVWSAKAMSYGLGVICSYLLNAGITFRHQVSAFDGAGVSLHGRLFMRFLAVALLCLLVNSLSYAWLAGDEYMALLPLILATLMSYVIGFTLNHLWTFGRGLQP